jgi:hypothetical protein
MNADVANSILDFAAHPVVKYLWVRTWLTLTLFLPMTITVVLVVFGVLSLNSKNIRRRVSSLEPPSHEKCEIWSFHGGENSGWGILGCDTMCYDRIPTFQWSMLPPGGWMQHGPLKRWYPTTTLHDVTTQKTSTWIHETVLSCYTFDSCIIIVNNRPCLLDACSVECIISYHFIPSVTVRSSCTMRYTCNFQSSCRRFVTLLKVH